MHHSLDVRCQALVNPEIPQFGNSPKHLRELYSIDGVGSQSGNSMAVTAFLEQYYSVVPLCAYHVVDAEGWGCHGVLTSGCRPTCTSSGPSSAQVWHLHSLDATESIRSIALIWGVPGLLMLLWRVCS